MCSRAGWGSWFAMRYAAALAHLVGRPCSSLMMDKPSVAICFVKNHIIPVLLGLLARLLAVFVYLYLVH